MLHEFLAVGGDDLGDLLDERFFADCLVQVVCVGIPGDLVEHGHVLVLDHAGEEDDGTFGIGGADEFAELEAVDSGHDDVEKQDVEILFLELLEGVDGVGAGHELEAVSLQASADDHQVRLYVVNGQDFDHIAHSNSGVERTAGAGCPCSGFRNGHGFVMTIIYP